MVKHKGPTESDETVFDEPRFKRYVHWSCCPVSKRLPLNFFAFRMILKSQ